MKRVEGTENEERGDSRYAGVASAKGGVRSKRPPGRGPQSGLSVAWRITSVQGHQAAKRRRKLVGPVLPTSQTGVPVHPKVDIRKHICPGPR